MAILLCTWVGACAAPNPREVGERGDTGWLVARTAHFAIITDLDEKQARREADRYESGWRAVSGFEWPRWPEWLDAWDVVVLRRKRVMEGYSGTTRWWAVYNPEAPLRPMAVTYYRTVGEGVPYSVQEALGMHAVTQTTPLGQPWLAMGLASYLGTSYLQASEGRFIYGRIPPGYDRALVNVKMPSAQPLLRGEWDDDDPMCWVLAWTLVHFLIDEHTDGFLLYRRLLAAGVAPESAWGQAFADLSVRGVDDALRSYVLGNRVQIFAMPASKGNPRVSIRQARPAEVHLVRAKLAYFRPGEEPPRVEEARAELSSALLSEWDNVPALEMAWHTPELGLRPSLDTLARTARFHATDPRAALLYVEALRQLEAPVAQRTKAVRQALLEARHPRLWVEQATLELELGKFESALTTIDAYLETYPGDWDAHRVRAIALSRLGECEKLSDVRKGLAGLRLSDSDLQDEFARLEGACVAGASKPGQ